MGSELTHPPLMQVWPPAHWAEVVHCVRHTTPSQRVPAGHASTAPESVSGCPQPSEAGMHAVVIKALKQREPGPHSASAVQRLWQPKFCKQP